MTNGILLLNKATGISSARVLAPLKRIFPGRRIGHTGTLDPFAEGLLVVLIGTATRLSRWFLALDKCYEAGVVFGEETSTLDTEGEVIATAAPPSLARLNAACSVFRGRISQVPPAYSALKVNGQRAYERARRGEQVDLPAREIMIHRLDLMETDTRVTENSDEPGTSSSDRVAAARIGVCCSSGTYIRSLARDIALQADSRGHCRTLRRTAVGPFALKHAYAVDALAAMSAPERALIPIVDAVRRMEAMPLHPVDAEQTRHLRTGRPLHALQGLPPVRQQDWLLCTRDAEQPEPVAVLAARDGRWSYETVFPEPGT